MDASNAKIQYESGQDQVAFVALTDQGDHKDFRSADPLWSNRAGYEPDVKPNGLATGGAITPAVSGTKEAVDVAAFTCYLAGVLTQAGADTDVLVVRPAASPESRRTLGSTALPQRRGSGLTALWCRSRKPQGRPWRCSPRMGSGVLPRSVLSASRSSTATC